MVYLCMSVCRGGDVPDNAVASVPASSCSLDVWPLPEVFAEQGRPPHWPFYPGWAPTITTYWGTLAKPPSILPLSVPFYPGWAPSDHSRPAAAAGMAGRTWTQTWVLHGGADPRLQNPASISRPPFGRLAVGPGPGSGLPSLTLCALPGLSGFGPGPGPCPPPLAPLPPHRVHEPFRGSC